MPIQIKRSNTTPVPATLANGELAFTAAGNILFIGVNSSVLPIAGERNPGILTANQAVVTNSSNFIDGINVANSIFLGNTGGSNLRLTIPNGGARIASNGSLDIFSNNYIKLHSNPNSAVLSGTLPDSNWVIVDDEGIFIQSFDEAGTTVADITVEPGGVKILGEVTPLISNTYSLGNTSFTWRNVYVGNLVSVGITSLNTSGFAVGSSITGNTSRLAIGTSVGIQANGTIGTLGQVLTSNGSTAYWSTLTATGTLTQVNTGIGLVGGPITTNGTISVLANSGIVANTTGIFVNTSFIGTLTANNSTNFGGLSLATVQGQITGNAATAYTNAVAYVDGKAYVNTSQLSANVTTLQGQITGNAATAYTNAVSYVTGQSFANTSQLSANVATLQGQITSNSATAYTNATAYVDGKAYVNTAQLSANVVTLQGQITSNAAAAYTNATTFASNASNITNGIIAEPRLPFRMDQNIRTTDNVNFGSVTISGNLTVNGSYTVVTGNSVVYTDNMLFLNQGISANITNIVANGTHIIFTANNNFQVGWDALVSGVNPSSYDGLYLSITASNTTSFTVANTKTGAYVSGGVARGQTESNPDLGFAAGYNDGTYAHAGFFRDHLTGVWKVFDGYLPEPDASVYIDQANTSFTIAPFQASELRVGNNSNYGVVNTTNFTGTSNNTLNLGGLTAASYVNTAQLTANLALYQTNAGLASNVATLTSNNSTNFDGLSLATVQGQITGNAATAYTNAVAYVDGKSFVNTAQLSANLTNYQTTAGLASNVATLTANNSTNFDGLSLATVQGQITSNAATAYTNAVAYVDGKSYVNTAQLSANVTTLQGQITSNAATAYSNAVAYVDGKSYVNTAQLSGNLALYATIANPTFTGNVTTGNVIIQTSGGIRANGSFGAAGQVLTSNGTTVYWDTVSASGGFTNGQSISVNNFVITGAFTANSSTGSAGQILISNGSGVYWGPPPSGGGGTVTQVDTGSGLAGGPVTTSGTISVLANTGIIANSNGLFVNSAYIATIDVNNATNFDGLSLLTVQGQITGNAATAYTNAVAYVDGKNFVNTSQLSANLTNYQTTAGLSSNVATLTSNNSTNFDGLSLATVQGQITGNAATAYTNAVAYVDGKSYVNTSQLSANLTNYQTTAGLSANVATLTSNNSTNFDGLSLATVQGQITGNAATAYTNAVAYVDGKSYVNTSQLSSNLTNYVNTSQLSANLTLYATLADPVFTGNVSTGNVIVSTSGGINANGSFGSAGQILISNGTSIYWGASPSGGGGTVTQVDTGSGLIGGPLTTTGTISVLANSGIIANTTGVFVNSAYIGTLTANNSTNFDGLSLATVQSQITGNAATAYTNAVAYVDGKSYVNTSQLASNLALYATLADPTFTGDVTTANVIIGATGGIRAGGSYGSAGQVLHTNGTGVYWDVDDQGVTQVVAGAGLSGGTITSTGTVAVLANSGIVSNTTGVFVNTAFIGTLTANNSTNFNNEPASFYANATNLTSGTLNNARLPATINITTVNAATLSVGSIVVANTTGITTTANMSISATGELIIAAGAGIQANGSFGTAGQALYSNGTSIYWDTVAAGVNTAATFAWTNTHSFAANLTIGTTSELIIANGAGIQANGGFGTSGQVLSSNGTGVYWATSSGGGGGRIDPRVSSTASASSVTPDISSFDMYVFTALATGLTINASTSGAPLNGNKLTFRFKDDGTSRGLTWTTAGSNSFRAVGVTLPTSTTINKVTYVGCIYNSDESFWDVVAVLTQV